MQINLPLSIVSFPISAYISLIRSLGISELRVVHRTQIRAGAPSAGWVCLLPSLSASLSETHTAARGGPWTCAPPSRSATPAPPPGPACPRATTPANYCGTLPPFRAPEHTVCTFIMEFTKYYIELFLFLHCQSRNIVLALWMR